ncbi:uncharacterized protein [Montipora capricornis]|uniref:uncharacterized protein isoform X1 n=1 Tax=Montipora capricornis TaxID=246305 RepID=UPI0035F1A890
MAPRQILNESATNPFQAWEDQQALQLNEAVVTPGFAYNLARYFPSGTHNDKTKCIELMDKVGASSDPATWYSPVSRAQMPTRPKSVPPAESRFPENNKQSYTRNPELFYMTTNQREYGGTFGYPAGNARPSSSKIFPSRSNNNPTSYRTDFNQKYVGKTKPIRAGTASGSRRNNPHPSEAFMIWKFPSRLPLVFTNEKSPEAMSEVFKDQIKSTYQFDYTGIPQGVNISTAFAGGVVPSVYKPPYTLDSTARCSYQAPVVKSELSENLSSRFGCNKKAYKRAVGAVPTVLYNSPQMHLHGKSEYSTEYVNKSATLKEEAKRLKSGPIPALAEYLKTAKPHERASLLRKLQKISANDKKENHDPGWVSLWTGPS